MFNLDSDNPPSQNYPSTPILQKWVGSSEILTFTNFIKLNQLLSDYFGNQYSAGVENDVKSFLAENFNSPGNAANNAFLDKILELILNTDTLEQPEPPLYHHIWQSQKSAMQARIAEKLADVENEVVLQFFSKLFLLTKTTFISPSVFNSDYSSRALVGLHEQMLRFTGLASDQASNYAECRAILDNLTRWVKAFDSNDSDYLKRVMTSLTRKEKNAFIAAVFNFYISEYLNKTPDQARANRDHAFFYILMNNLSVKELDDVKSLCRFDEIVISNVATLHDLVVLPMKRFILSLSAQLNPVLLKRIVDILLENDLVAISFSTQSEPLRIFLAMPRHVEVFIEQLVGCWQENLESKKIENSQLLINIYLFTQEIMQYTDKHANPLFDAMVDDYFVTPVSTKHFLDHKVHQFPFLARGIFPELTIREDRLLNSIVVYDNEKENELILPRNEDFLVAVACRLVAMKATELSPNILRAFAELKKESEFFSCYLITAVELRNIDPNDTRNAAIAVMQEHRLLENSRHLHILRPTTWSTYKDMYYEKNPGEKKWMAPWSFLHFGTKPPSAATSSESGVELHNKK